MKKVIGIVLGLLIMQSASVFAATMITKSTYTATVDFSGFSAVTYLNVVLKNRTSGAAATQFSFTPTASALLAGTSFYTANEYAIIYTTWTSAAPGRVMIYTDNEAADANPRYTGTGNPAGLVCSTSTISTEAPLSLCWRAVDESTTTTNIGWWLEGSSMHLYALGLSQSFYCNIWMKDKGDTTPWYGTDNAYPTVKSFDSQGGWLQYAEAQFGTTSSPDYLYLGANLGTAKAGRTYKTNTMRFDMILD